MQIIKPLKLKKKLKKSKEIILFRKITGKEEKTITLKDWLEDEKKEKYCCGIALELPLQTYAKFFRELSKKYPNYIIKGAAIKEGPASVNRISIKKIFYFVFIKK